MALGNMKGGIASFLMRLRCRPLGGRTIAYDFLRAQSFLCSKMTTMRWLPIFQYIIVSLNF